MEKKISCMLRTRKRKHMNKVTAVGPSVGAQHPAVSRKSSGRPTRFCPHIHLSLVCRLCVRPMCGGLCLCCGRGMRCCVWSHCKKATSVSPTAQPIASAVSSFHAATRPSWIELLGIPVRCGSVGLAKVSGSMRQLCGMCAWCGAQKTVLL